MSDILGNSVQDVGVPAISREYAETPTRQHKKETARGRCRAVHDIHQESDTSGTLDKEIDVVKTKVFNFNSVRLIIITKFGTKTSAITAICNVNLNENSIIM